MKLDRGALQLIALRLIHELTAKLGLMEAYRIIVSLVKSEENSSLYQISN